MLNMLKKKLLIIVAIIFILALGSFYWLNLRQREQSNQVLEKAATDARISAEILQKIGPPPGFDESKVTELDPEILKLIGPSQ